MKEFHFNFICLLLGFVLVHVTFGLEQMFWAIFCVVIFLIGTLYEICWFGKRNEKE